MPIRNSSKESATSQLIEALSGTSPSVATRNHSKPLSDLRGVFRKDSNHIAATNRRRLRSTASASPRHSSHLYRVTALKQTLDMVLASDESVQMVAQKLYGIFNGDCSKLIDLQRLLESKWKVPARLFPLLFANIRRACASADDPSHVSVGDWVEAFKRWIQSVHARCSDSQLTRRYFVQMHHRRDLSDTYLEGKMLGAGSFGAVYLMLHKTLGVARVVKHVHKTVVDIASEHIDGEIALLTSLDHPHIVRLYEAFETDDTISLVMDYAAGGDLASVIAMEIANQRTLEEFWVRCAVSQIGAAIEYMHSKGVIHCDLKPANSMLLYPYARMKRPHILLVDFGISEIFEERRSGDTAVIKGTPAYMAPEGFENCISTKSDIWALGIMVHELLLGRRPFKPAKNVFVQYVEVRKTDPDLTELSELPRDLVTKLLAKDAKDRPTATECRGHPWLQKEALPALSSNGSQILAESSTLANFTKKTFFERAAMLGIATGLGMQDVQELNAIFEALDTHKKGTLNLEELAEGLQKLELPYSPQDLMAMLDMDHSGDISYTELIAGLLSAERDVTERRVQNAFEMFDLDGNGYISMLELRLMLSGEGPLADVLPDGTTVEQVMDEVTGGKDNHITLDQFRAYLRRNVHLTCGTKSSDIGLGLASASNCKLPMCQPLTVTDLVDHLDARDLKSLETISLQSQKSWTFPGIHKWLDVVFADAYSGAGFTWFFTFSDVGLEAAYVSHYTAQTCLQTMLLCLVLVLYSLWSLFIESWTWSPIIFRWNEPVLAAHNMGWLFLLTSGMLMMLVCILMRRTFSERLANDSYAVRFERGLCLWTCITPWVSCFLANRFRVARLFDVDPATVFGSFASDYDLLFAIIGTQMFFAMRTHLRFVSCVCLAISCGAAYCTTTFSFGMADMNCSGHLYWTRPTWLLLVISFLELSGQRIVEYHKRIHFLSLYASHRVLRASHEQNPRLSIGALERGSNTSRSARLKLALDLVKDLKDANDPIGRPMHKALSCIFEIVQSVREDVAQADRFLQVSIDEALLQNGGCGSVCEELLAMFDAAPPMHAPPQGTENSSLPNLSSEAWGWDVLSVSQPLFAVWRALFLPIVAHAVAIGEGGEVLVEGMAFQFCDSLMSGVKGRCVQARAALAVHATHWLAQRIGLWEILAPWDRVALIVAAAGLHVSDGGCITLQDPLVAHAMSFRKTVDALEESGLGHCSIDGSLRRLVKGLLMRARPRRMLEDIRFLKIALESHDEIFESEANRAALLSMVLAAADLAFLALPQVLHHAWVKLCIEEASIERSRVDINFLGWFEGLIKLLALPIYDTLDSIKGAHLFLSVPRGQLRANELHLRSTVLRAAPTRESVPKSPYTSPIIL